jgi:hypothetical protein
VDVRQSVLRHEAGGSDFVAPATTAVAVGGAVPATTAVVLVGLVGAGAVLRLWGLGANRLGFDEAFTALAGRMPVGTMLSYLRTRDSHPPLDYLLRAPLDRATTSAWLLRLPSVACSIGAVALLAWWLRRWGIAAMVATALIAVAPFFVLHGRDARMYAELQLLGVGAAVLADAWLRRPRRRHAVAIGVLVLAGLLTHVQVFLLAGGLVVLAGIRTDRAAWEWRAGIAAGIAGWAVLWGPSFWVQQAGGHSSWIPRTTVDGVVQTVGSLIATDAAWRLPVLAAVVVGGWAVARADRHLGRVVLCCSFVPIALAALAGTDAPVLIDRTLTVAAWGLVVALGFLVAVLVHAAAKAVRVAGVGLLVGLLALTLPSSVHAVATPSEPDRVLRAVAALAGPGDAVVLFPGPRLHELVWSLGVVRGGAFQDVRVVDHPQVRGILLEGDATGRLWWLRWKHRRDHEPDWPRCAARVQLPGAVLDCLLPPPGALAVTPGPYDWAQVAPR